MHLAYRTVQARDVARGRERFRGLICRGERPD
jgi:hypothetical protein